VLESVVGSTVVTVVTVGSVVVTDTCDGSTVVSGSTVVVVVVVDVESGVVVGSDASVPVAVPVVGGPEVAPTPTHCPACSPANSPYFLPDGHDVSGKLHTPAASHVPGSPSCTHSELWAHANVSSCTQPPAARTRQATPDRTSFNMAESFRNAGA
jgi:hypothetical protein